MDYISLVLLSTHKDFQKVCRFLKGKGFCFYVTDSLTQTIHGCSDLDVFSLNGTRVIAILNGKNFESDLISFIEKYRAFNDGPIIRYSISECG